MISMRELGYSEKKVTGFTYVADLLEPASCFGADSVRHIRFYEPTDRAELLTELENVEKIADIFIGCREKIGNIQGIMVHFKDIRRTLTRPQEYCFSDVELFELKHFLLRSVELAEAVRDLLAECPLDGIEFQDLSEALNLLDPDHRRRPGFFISEEYSEELRDIRAEKKMLEQKMRGECEGPEMERLRALRQGIVAREEEEEGRIRKGLTQRLRPHFSGMLRNARMTARLDVLIEKARLAVDYGCKKPIVTEDELWFEDMIHPQIGHILAESGKSFTPLSLHLRRGSSVITGANMGGKSVALKTTALNTMLVLCGFYPFAESAGVPMFEGIHMIAEDRQSADQGLSSFGAEIVQLKEVIHAAKHSFSLILMDEFARGTNPDEGAAIAAATAEYFNEQQSIMLMTTHYDNVAEQAGAHYQVIGLRNVEVGALRNEIAVSSENGVDIIARHMNYGLYRVSGREDCPHDALNICRMLDLDEEILKIIEGNCLRERNF